MLVKIIMYKEISRIIINYVGEWNNKVGEHIEINSLVECSLDSVYTIDEFP